MASLVRTADRLLRRDLRNDLPRQAADRPLPIRGRNAGTAPCR
jgi:hypothetical protein